MDGFIKVLIGAIHLLTLQLYSDLNATIGSTRVARRAGIKQADTETNIKTIDTPAKVSGSVGETP